MDTDDSQRVGKDFLNKIQKVITIKQEVIKLKSKTSMNQKTS